MRNWGPIVTDVDSPVAAGSAPVYQVLLLDGDRSPIAPPALSYLTLTICDTLSGTVVNGAQGIDVLNIGRGTLDAFGVLTLALEPGDTSMAEVPGEASVQRSLVLDCAINGGTSPSRRQINLTIVALSGP